MVYLEQLFGSGTVYDSIQDTVIASDKLWSSQKTSDELSTYAKLNNSVSFSALAIAGVDVADALARRVPTLLDGESVGGYTGVVIPAGSVTIENQTSGGGFNLWDGGVNGPQLFGFTDTAWTHFWGIGQYNSPTNRYWLDAGDRAFEFKQQPYIGANAILDASKLGVANGIATLDSGGKVPATQLPAFVDDVIEVANFAALPATGSAGVIYVTLDNNKTWRWGGSAYAEISASPGSTDAVTEGSINLYFTNARAVAALGPTLANYVTSSSLNTTLANYATTASLANYATTASLANYAALAGATFTGDVTVNTKVGIGQAPDANFPLAVHSASGKVALFGGSVDGTIGAPQIGINDGTRSGSFWISSTEFGLGSFSNVDVVLYRQSVEKLRLNTNGALLSGSLALAPMVDPAAPADGTIWYSSAEGKFKKRQGGSTSDMDTTPTGGGFVTDGDKGDVLVAGGGYNWTVQGSAGDFDATGNLTVGGTVTVNGASFNTRGGTTSIGPTGGTSDNSVYFETSNYYHFWTFRRWAAGAPSTQAQLQVADAGFYWSAGSHVFRNAAADTTYATINSGGLTVSVAGGVWSQITGGAGVRMYDDANAGYIQSYNLKPLRLNYSGNDVILPTATFSSTGAAFTGTLTVGGNAVLTAADKGAANGVASLDATGKVPAAQLPSFVDDVIEAADFASLPGTGSTGVIYVTLNDNKTYRWSGSAYVNIAASPGSTDAVPEGATNKYYTDVRVRAATLTGLIDVAGTVADTDTLLNALGKLRKGLADANTAIAGKQASGSYALTTGATFTGTLTMDSNIVMRAGPYVIFKDSTGATEYGRIFATASSATLRGNAHSFQKVDGTVVASLDNNGGLTLNSGSNTALILGARDGTSTTATLYNTANLFRVYFGADRFTVDSSGNITATGAATITGTTTSGSIISTNGNFVARGSGVGGEGGQLTLGYGNNLATGITGPGGNNTWSVDVLSDQTFRIFRTNGAGSSLIAMSIAEADGTATFAADIKTPGKFVTTNSDGLLLHSGTTSTPTAIFRNDGSNFYFLCTNNETTPSNSWNGLRPLMINMASGAVTMSNGLTVNGGGLNVSSGTTTLGITNTNDITASRGDGTGVIFLGGGSRYLYYNGTTYVLQAAGLTVGGSVTASGLGDFITPNSGTTGGVRVRQGAAGNAIIQFTNNAASAEWGNLQVTSTGSMTWSGGFTATTITGTSDKRLKTNIRTVENALDKVAKMRGVHFEWKASGEASSGVIAQEHREVAPEAVIENDEGVLSVNDAATTAYLIEAIKELKGIVEAQAREIAELKAAA
jgi:hypothetical protein